MEPALGRGQARHLAPDPAAGGLPGSGVHPSLSKVAALWSGTPVTVRLEDLDMICAALQCTVADLMEAEPVAAAEGRSETEQRAVGESGPARPIPRPGSGGARRSLPPN